MKSAKKTTLANAPVKTDSSAVCFFLMTASACADYAPPGYFAAHPLVQGFQMRDRFIGLDMDKAKDELVKAYQYEADTHGQVVRDGLTLRIQVRGSHTPKCQQCVEEAPPLAGSYLFIQGKTSYQCLLQVTGYVVDDTAPVWTLNGTSALLLSMAQMLDLHWDCPRTIQQPKTCSCGHTYQAYVPRRRAKQAIGVCMSFCFVSKTLSAALQGVGWPSMTATTRGRRLPALPTSTASQSRR